MKNTLTPILLLALVGTSLFGQEQFGDFRANSWRPYNSASDDLYIDAEPGTRLLRTRNWNTNSPNIRATGIHTGQGIFDTSLAVYAVDTDSSFSILNNSNNSLSVNLTRSDGSTVFGLDAHSMVTHFGGRIGIGTTNPEAALHIVTNTTNSTDNSIRIYAPNLGPYNSHIHYGLNGDWYIRSAKAGGTVILQDTPGNVGIGTATPDHKLDVNGTIRAKEVIVETGWSDFVFEGTYRLRSLEEVENHIEKHGHLPDVPSAAVVESEGLSVGEAQKIMMQKIEELTLYVIDLQKQNNSHLTRISELESKLSQQNARYNSE